MPKLNVSEKLVSLDILPDECPVCHVKIVPQYKMGIFILSMSSHIQAVFQCPSEDCGYLFFSLYSPRSESLWHFDTSYPQAYIKRSFNNIISSISPRFVNIYNQAFRAETLKLDDIAGPGYRKAFEFLIKDYCIKQNSEDEERIKHMFLMDCIKKYLKQEELLMCAERATWLGNDETHYMRIWEDKDISDLKNLIDMTINWIELLERSLHYEDSMKRKKQHSIE